MKQIKKNQIIKKQKFIVMNLEKKRNHNVLVVNILKL